MVGARGFGPRGTQAALRPLLDPVPGQAPSSRDSQAPQPVFPGGRPPRGPPPAAPVPGRPVWSPRHPQEAAQPWAVATQQLSAGRVKMQGLPELGGEPVSDPAGESGEVSLLQTSGGLSADRLERTESCCAGPGALPERKASGPRLEEGLPTCPPSCPHSGELCGGWGEFESFQESEAEQSSQSLGLPGRRTGPQRQRTPSVPKEHGSCQAQQGGPWVTGTAAGPSSELILSSENVFRFAFQEVSVEQAAEDICSLIHFLEINSEESAGLASVPRLCSESRKLWRALQNTDTVSPSQGLWSDSRCQENLFLVLDIDTSQKSLSRVQGHTPEGSDLREPEDLLEVSSFHLHHCKALIQTKLSGTPGGGKGSLITYSLFLKTPLHGNGHCITIPRKKILTPRTLKMAFFKDVR